FLCGVESVDACVLRDWETQHADGGEFSGDWRESFPQLALYIPAWLGTPRPCVLDEPRCDDQFAVALRADAQAYAQAGNAPDAACSRKDLSRGRASGVNLMGGKLLVAGRVGGHEVF